MRDRAFTYMDDLVSQIRQAGRYAFRCQPEFLKHFGSRYCRRTRGAKSSTTEAKGSTTKWKQEVVEEEVVGEPVFVA